MNISKLAQSAINKSTAELQAENDRMRAVLRDIRRDYNQACVAESVEAAKTRRMVIERIDLAMNGAEGA